MGPLSLLVLALASSSSAPEAVVVLSSAGRIHHRVTADPLHQMIGRVQQRLPSPYGVLPGPVQGPRSLCRSRLENLLPSTGHRLGPKSWALFPDRRSPIFKWAVSSTAGVKRAPRVSPQCSSGPPPVPPRSPLPPATSHRLFRRRRSTRAPGFRAELRRTPRPIPLRHAGVLQGTKFWLRRFPPGQAIPVCVDCPAGPREELYVRILWQAPSEPFDYAPDILAGFPKAIAARFFLACSYQLRDVVVFNVLHLGLKCHNTGITQRKFAD
ncbi:hypothetical protein NDU88_003839 [Pleurodeles waltl]|uniref:Uncharacterized protein n=1 Tax=Pleurodeles waltl TaxID=8319 RepID=A0AAV7M8A3_PLEWA|nr:hypothetical protein NDU88_003839 [Pleurodeles waltl]